MRSKAPLALMEQLIMVLVFALAAALCLQMFALSDRISREKEAQDHMVILAQNVAELVKHTGGAPEQHTRRVPYDKNLTETTPENAVYWVSVQGLDSDIAGLNRAVVIASSAAGIAEDFTLDLCWQGEVTGHG